MKRLFRRPEEMPETEVKDTRSVKYYLAGAVALATVAVYLSALHNDFIVGWDDGDYVLDNPHIRSFDTAFFKWAFFDFHASNWHPLTWISHALDYALWGMSPFGHHLTSVVLHGFNTLIVVLLVLRLMAVSQDAALRQRKAVSENRRAMLMTACATGLLFGLHPLHVESVAWIAERKDLLCALFFLLSIMVYVNYVESRQSTVSSQKSEVIKRQSTINNRQSATCYLLTLGFFVLALLSKPMAVTLPMVLLILDWYPLSRIESWKTFLHALVEKLPFFALSLVSSIMTVLAQKEGGAIASIEVIPSAMRLYVAAKSLFDYLVRMVFPVNLVPFYPYPASGEVSLGHPAYLAAVVFLIAVTITCIALARKQKLWLSVWGYFIVTLIPVLGIVQVGSQATADRYTYLPSLGPFLVMGLTTAWIRRKIEFTQKPRPFLKLLSGTVAACAVVSLMYLTLAQIIIWRNALTLWTHAVETSPGVTNAYLNRAYAFRKRGLLDKAITDYDRAISLKPNGFIAHYNLGNIYLQQGRTDDALEQYRLTVTIKPDYAEGHNNLGVALDDKGWTDQAIEQYRMALSLEPGYAEGHYNLGQAYLKKGLIDEAIEQFKIAVALDPGNRDFKNDLADAYGRIKAARQ